MAQLLAEVVYYPEEEKEAQQCLDSLMGLVRQKLEPVVSRVVPLANPCVGALKVCTLGIREPEVNYHHRNQGLSLSYLGD